MSALKKLHDYIWPEELECYQLHSSLYLNRNTLNQFRLSCFLLYYLPCTLYTFIFGGLPFYYFLFFFTIWGHLACMVYFVCIYFVERSIRPDNLPQKGFAWKFTHILFEMAFAAEVTIPVFFWAVLAAPYFESVKNDDDFTLILIINILVHGVTPLLIYLEVAFNYIPFHFRHAYVFIPIVGVVYSCINAIGVLVLQIQIYQPIIDWKSVGTPLFLALAFSLTLGGFAIGRFIHQRKEKVFHRRKSLLKVGTESQRNEETLF